MLRMLVLAAAVLLSSPALAYIGPGAGISVLGSLLGILATIVVAIGAIVMWPLRKVLKKRRQASAQNATSPENTPADDSTAVGDAEDSRAAPGEHG